VAARHCLTHADLEVAPRCVDWRDDVLDFGHIALGCADKEARLFTRYHAFGCDQRLDHGQDLGGYTMFELNGADLILGGVRSRDQQYCQQENASLNGSVHLSGQARDGAPHEMAVPGTLTLARAKL
jgi:hypothetical protein